VISTTNGGGFAWIRSWLAPLIAAALFGIALWVLRRELRAIDFQDVRAALGLVRAGRFALAVLVAGMSYLALTGYDQLAFLRLGRKISPWRVTATAFAGCAVSNSVGFALLSGTAVRHRFYSRWGVSMTDLAGIVLFNALTFWLGLLTLIGWSLVSHSYVYVQGGLAGANIRLLGGAALALVAVYVIFSMVRSAPLRVYGYEIMPPRARLVFAQVLVSMADWGLAGTLLYLLLPAGGPSHGVVLSAFLAAHALGLISNVPGGLGVFEATLVLLLGPYLPAEQLVAALLLYRLVYNLVPLILALVLLLVDELRSRRAQLRQLGKLLGDYSAYLVPAMLAVFTFMAGMVLLIPVVTRGGTTGAFESMRLSFAVSYVLRSLIGVSLLVLAQAVSRRVRRAYYLVIGALLAGIVLSLYQTSHWREPVLLLLLLVMIAPGGGFVNRGVPLFDTRFSPGWIVAITAGYLSSFWLGMFFFPGAHRPGEGLVPVGVFLDLRWFLLNGGSMASVVALIGFSGWRLSLPMPHVAELPTDADLEVSRRIIETQPETLPYLVYLRDKALLFNSGKSAFVMYGVRGRTWAALGDPVGPAEKRPALARVFMERAYDYGGVPLFYDIHPAQLHMYVDLGMTVFRLGEEGRVALGGSPSGSTRPRASLERKIQSATDTLARTGMRFRVIDPRDVPSILPQLRELSEEWLERMAVRERGFSMGSFDESYLSRLPIAVLERDDAIIAFTNLLCGPTGEELAVDLLRTHHSAPAETMDILFALLCRWGRERGYRWFNLGLAPAKRLWTRVGRFAYRQGDSFRTLEELRAYKETFYPRWEPRYLAHPTGLALPVILADVAALVAGGYTKIFR
jgi:phosphatidylglycerol lysyltransferase